MKLRFPTIEPLFETSALVDRHRGYTFAGI
jgi:hypothetical protein